MFVYLQQHLHAFERCTHRTKIESAVGKITFFNEYLFSLQHFGLEALQIKLYSIMNQKYSFHLHGALQAFIQSRITPLSTEATQRK